MSLRTSALLLVVLLSASASVAATEAAAEPVDLSAKAPETFEAKFETSIGDFVIEVNRAWAPLGADRFYNLVKSGYYDNLRFFPVVAGYAVQFPIYGNDSALAPWKGRQVQDPARESNKAGFVAFAKDGSDSIPTQVFINLSDNSRLDSQGFAPFGKVTQGMEVVAKPNSRYAMTQKASKLDVIRKASVVSEPAD